jgi:hypothetical protein
MGKGGQAIPGHVVSFELVASSAGGLAAQLDLLNNSGRT